MLLYLILASQLSLGVVFLLSALSKIRRPRTFARSVVAYQILPPPVAYVFGLALIPVEAGLAIALLTGLAADVALPVAFSLLTAFLGAVLVNLRRHRRIACGCFGDMREQSSHRTVARLLLLLAVVLFVIASRAAEGWSSPGVAAALAEGWSPAQLSATTFLAVSMLLLGAWILALPEWLGWLTTRSDIATRADGG